MRVPTVLAALTATLALAGPVACWPGTAVARTPVTDFQRDIFTVTNEERDAHDRTDFRHQSCVQRYAERQAKRMAARGEIFHQDLSRVLRDCDGASDSLRSRVRRLVREARATARGGYRQLLRRVR